MFLTQPPMRSFRNTSGRIEKTITSHEVGITVKELLDTLKSTLEPEDRDQNHGFLERTDGCRYLGRSVDDITGWEVLEIFKRSVREHEYDSGDGVFKYEEKRLPWLRVETWYDPDGSEHTGASTTFPTTC